jgi:hypothetical protein
LTILLPKTAEVQSVELKLFASRDLFLEVFGFYHSLVNRATKPAVRS